MSHPCCSGVALTALIPASLVRRSAFLSPPETTSFLLHSNTQPLSRTAQKEEVVSGGERNALRCTKDSGMRATLTY